MRSVTTARKKTNGASFRDEALLILDKRGAILDLAREVSRLMRNAGIPGVVIGGVAVVLHGHLRTTKDVDIFVSPPLKPLADLLTNNGYAFDRAERAFIKHGVPVHLVSPEQVGSAPKESVEIDGVTTVALPDLIAMKLRSGSANLLRAQDLADVIGLMRHHRLTGDFARRLDKNLRTPFRKLVRLIQREKSGK
ncbi:MAG: nucleotidyltransferase [Deltaproteobacteria bacterium]|nr:nucleotidyltransferase [Deltaproteobacteria bacterium]